MQQSVTFSFDGTNDEQLKTYNEQIETYNEQHSNDRYQDRGDSSSTTPEPMDRTLFISRNDPRRYSEIGSIPRQFATAQNHSKVPEWYVRQMDGSLIQNSLNIEPAYQEYQHYDELDDLNHSTYVQGIMSNVL